MGEPLEDAKVSCATPKLANGSSKGGKKLDGGFYKALDKEPETEGMSGGARRVLEVRQDSEQEIPAGQASAGESSLAL
jgi:hypothetical protein